MRLRLLPLVLLAPPACGDGDAPVSPPDPVSTPDAGPPDAYPQDGDAGGVEPRPSDTSPAADATLADATPDADAGRDIGWCVLQHPRALSAAPGGDAGLVYGRVFVAGLTDAPRDGLSDHSALEGELGWAAAGDAAVEARWSWIRGVNARAVDANHEFEATLTAPSEEGVFRYAWRFRASSDAPWMRCDLGGSDDGFDPLDAGQLTVTAPRVGWCRVQHPVDELLMMAGETTERLYGRVFAEVLTGDARRGAVTDVESQVGYGPRGSTPDDSWTWVVGAFNVVVDNDLDGARSNDEHVATLTVPNPGTYAWTWRFRVSPAGPWRVCDLAGADPADPAALPRLTVVSAPQ